MADPIPTGHKDRSLEKAAQAVHRRAHIGELKPDERNTRRHNPRNVGAIERAISTEGFGRSILVANDGTVIAGNATIEAAVAAGIEDVLIVETDGRQIIAVKRTDVESGTDRFRNLSIGDNRSAELATWNTEELQALIDDGVDLSSFWFDEELDALLAENVVETQPLTDPDDVPAVPDDPITKPGDVWHLGRHRVMCGDSTVVTDVDRLMAGQQFDLLMTDPPYGVKRDQGFGATDGFGGKGRPIARKQYEGEWDNDIPPKECFDLMLTLAPKALIFGGNFFAHLLPQGTHWVVWDKKNTMPSFGDAELVWTNVPRNSVKIKTFEYNGLIGKEKERHHATQKPVGLIAEMLEDYTDAGQTIVDLFGGSGSTLIACEQTHRTCYVMELDPKYVDVIVTRWELFSGQTATREEAVS